jgi:putative oxidoreductase
MAHTSQQDDAPGTTISAPPRLSSSGLDAALLILRLALGGTMLANGLRRFGAFDGPGIAGFA